MIMKESDVETIMFTPRGMNCKVYYKHCYHKKPCDGCLEDDRDKPEHCCRCKIRDCAKIGDLSYRHACSGYPCKLIKSLEKGYKRRYRTSLMENNEIVKNQGLGIFMEQQRKKYTCSTCGDVISIHDRECNECQEETFTIEKGQVQKLVEGI